MVIMNKTEVTMRAAATCPTHARADITFRDLTFAIDEPSERGGSNAGPTPTETALAALIGCTNVIGHKCADGLGADIGHLDIAAKCIFDRRGVTLEEEIEIPFRRIELTITSYGSASHVALQRVAQQFGKYCPLSKLFKAAGTEIEEIWQLAP